MQNAKRNRNKMYFLYTILFLVQLLGLSLASPIQDKSLAPRAEGEYWVAGVKHQGLVAFGNGTEYQVFRDVKEFGAKGESSLGFIIEWKC